MNLISLREYADMHGVSPDNVRQKILRGGFKTAQKIGRNWVIDKDEAYSDLRKTDMGNTSMDDVLKTYNATGSIKETAKIYEISEQKVRKILITKGVYSTPLSDKINKLRDQGLTPTEISKKLNISRAAVNSYMPYSKGQYKSDSPSENALRIRKSRDKRDK